MVKGNDTRAHQRGRVATIRVARPDDIGSIQDVQHRAGRAASDTFTAVMSAAIDDPERLVVVAEIDDLQVGWATTKFWPDAEGAAPAGQYLMGVTVAADFRRAGIGHALIAKRIEWIRHRTDRVMFFANARNAASLAAHRAWRFEEIARGSEFRGISFDGGLGLLYRAQLT